MTREAAGQRPIDLIGKRLRIQNLKTPEQEAVMDACKRFSHAAAFVVTHRDRRRTIR
jgi:hypothetical protein